MDFPELLLQLKNTILEILKFSGNKKVILVGHDWGAFLSYMLEVKYPDLIDGLGTLDVSKYC